MFSILTSKIFGGAALALLAALIFVYVSKTAVISHQDKVLEAQAETITNLRENNRILKGNADKLEFGLKQCNSSASAAAETAAAIGRAGVAAVEQVRRAGAARATVIERIQTMPTQSCADAEAILRAGGQQ